MDHVKAQLDKLLSEMATLPDNPAMEVVSHKPSLPPKLQNKSNETAAPVGKPIRECLESQDQLSDLLQQTYTILKKYGEAADATTIREAGFQWVLEDYTIEEVNKAFKTYLKTGKEIPTPADIIEILDPSVKPLCPKVYQRYVNLTKEGPFALTEAERDYIYQYEQQQLGRLK